MSRGAASLGFAQLQHSQPVACESTHELELYRRTKGDEASYTCL